MKGNAYKSAKLRMDGPDSSATLDVKKLYLCGQAKMSNFTLLFAGFLYFVFTCKF
jgi:hypothetical protein